MSAHRRGRWAKVPVYSGVERRHRWDDQTRLKFLSDAFAPSINVAEVARPHDVSTKEMYIWRRKSAVREPQAREPTDLGLAEAVLVESAGATPSGLTPTIVVDLAQSRRVTIFASTSATLVATALLAFDDPSNTRV